MLGTHSCNATAPSQWPSHWPLEDALERGRHQRPVGALHPGCSSPQAWLPTPRPGLCPGCLMAHFCNIHHTLETFTNAQACRADMAGYRDAPRFHPGGTSGGPVGTDLLSPQPRGPAVAAAPPPPPRGRPPVLPLPWCCPRPPPGGLPRPPPLRGTWSLLAWASWAVSASCETWGRRPIRRRGVWCVDSMGRVPSVQVLC